MDEKRKRALDDADRVIKDLESKRFNGWTNFDTWEARNLVETYEDIFKEVKKDLNYETLEWAVNTALERKGMGSEHIIFHLINWKELENHYLEMDRKKASGEF
jgi:hypothetical protein